MFLRNKKLRVFLFLAPTILFIIGLVSIPMSPKPWQGLASTLTQTLSLLAFTIGFYFVGIFILTILLRVIRPGIFVNTVYLFNHWGMHKKMGTVEYSIPWRDLVKWKETKSFIFIHVKNDAHVLSKKAISMQEQNDLRDFLNYRLGLNLE